MPNRYLTRANARDFTVYETKDLLKTLRKWFFFMYFRTYMIWCGPSMISQGFSLRHHCLSKCWTFPCVIIDGLHNMYIVPISLGFFQIFLVDAIHGQVGNGSTLMTHGVWSLSVAQPDALVMLINSLNILYQTSKFRVSTFQEILNTYNQKYDLMTNFSLIYLHPVTTKQKSYKLFLKFLVVPDLLRPFW